jgi:uncharacterized membrane protein
VVVAVFSSEESSTPYQRIGISAQAMFALIFAELAGSAVNIPITRLPAEPGQSVQDVQVFGMRFRLPVAREHTTTIAVNLGGAVIPTAVSVYLLVKDSIWGPAAVGVVVVTAVAHLLARPVRGVGITLPGFIPPLVAAGVALAVAPHMAAPVAYVSGTLGTLIGADLLNLPRLRELGGGVALIGGAARSTACSSVGSWPSCWSARLGTAGARPLSRLPGQAGGVITRSRPATVSNTPGNVASPSSATARGSALRTVTRSTCMARTPGTGRLIPSSRKTPAWIIRHGGTSSTAIKSSPWSSR